MMNGVMTIGIDRPVEPDGQYPSPTRILTYKLGYSLFPAILFVIHDYYTNKVLYLCKKYGYLT